MEKLPLVIDSSALLRDPRREKEATKALERLIAQGQVSLHLSEVILQEVAANIEAAAQTDLEKLDGAVSSLERRVPSRLAAESRERLRAAIHQVKEDLSGSLRHDFLAWLTTLQAEVLPIGAGTGSSVMEAYFQGSRPFRSVRHREDIPDAFIFDAVRGLALKGPLHAVISDKHLAEAVKSLQSVTVYSSLDEFVASPTIQPALRRLAGTANLELLRLLATEEPELVEEDISTDYIDHMAGETIYSLGIPGDNSEATISMVAELENLTFDWSVAEYYGEGSVSVPFSFTTNVYADSYIYKSDYYAMAEEDAEDLSITEWNDHFVQAEAEYLVQVTGRAVLTLPIDLSGEVLTRDALAAILPEVRLKIDTLDNIEVMERDTA